MRRSWQVGIFRSPMKLALLVAVLPAFSAFAVDSDKSNRSLPPAANRKVEFISEIYPIFHAACIPCHGPEKQKGKYRMDTREGAFKLTSDHGPAIAPKESAKSAIVLMMAGQIDEMLMPPPGGKPGESDPLTAEQIGLIRAWIDQGAEWPGGPISLQRKPIGFAAHIQPVLKQFCSECHSGASGQGGFQVDSLASVLRGGENYGKAVIPKDPGHSPLLTIVGGKDEDIPKPEKHRLPDKTVELIREWIQSGAPE